MNLSEAEQMAGHGGVGSNDEAQTIVMEPSWFKP